MVINGILKKIVLNLFGYNVKSEEKYPLILKQGQQEHRSSAFHSSNHQKCFFLSNSRLQSRKEHQNRFTNGDMAVRAKSPVSE